MGKHTPLYSCHQAMGGKLVDFAGWELPIHYGSQLQEHHRVRNAAGMFDVSHMTVVDLRGDQTRAFLRRLLANDVARLKTPGKALYSCMLNEQGGVIDDLISYFLSEQWFRLVVNAATRDKDIAWLKKQAAPFGVTVTVRDDLAMIAAQGPKARDKVAGLLNAERAAQVQALAPFHAASFDDGWFIARTGYTGEDGFEVILPATEAVDFWNALAGAGVAPCGLGARDTLRLEAGMNLYGSDMDESTHPLESALGWTIAWEPKDRQFIGRAAIEAQREKPARQLVGLLLTGKGVLRPHQRVVTAKGEGETTSGTYSPTLEHSIALARVPADCGEEVQVDIRGKLQTARVVKPPFARHGKPCVGLQSN